MEKSEMDRVLPMLLSEDQELVELGLKACATVLYDVNDFLMLRCHKEFPNLSPDTQEQIVKIFEKNAKKKH